MRETTDISYSHSTYELYETSKGADRVKKDLEIAWAKRTLDSWEMFQGYSLDVGCATGRYPLWLASRGFEALGYDKSDEAIAICREIAKGVRQRSHISFSVQDIVACELPSQHFTLITSMMGTLNHISVSSHYDVIEKYYNSLVRGGGLILSCWNPLCPFVGFLSFYSQQDRHILLSNSAPSSKIADILTQVGFQAVKCINFTALADDCYNSSEEILPADLLVEYDSRLISGSTLDSPGQMYLAIARKL